MSNIMVRDAFDRSVTCTRPPVRFQSSHESTVPKASSPRPAAALAPSTLSSIHLTLVAEKYGSMTSPVLSRTGRSQPDSVSSSHRPAVLRHCQTMALWMGWPVLRSQTSAVSRWLVMPRAAISTARTPPAFMASFAASS